jgi:hypothetical protein
VFMRQNRAQWQESGFCCAMKISLWNMRLRKPDNEAQGEERRKRGGVRSAVRTAMRRFRVYMRGTGAHIAGSSLSVRCWCAETLRMVSGRR